MLKSDKLIEDFFTINRKQKQEINQMARIQIASLKWGNTSLETLNSEELNLKLNSITDNEVHEFLNKLENQLESGKPSNSQDLDKFFEAIGMTTLEVTSLAKILKNDYFINALKDLKTLSENVLRKILAEVNYYNLLITQVCNENEVENYMKKIKLIFN